MLKAIKPIEDALLKGVNHMLNGFTFKSNANWVGKFNFIQMADTQFGLTEHFATNNDDNWDIEVQYTTKCIDIINGMNPMPEFAIVCGDMINSFPGGINRKAQISDFFKVFQRLLPSIPLICVCGNHDVGNSPTKETIEEYRNDFGDDYMQFWVKGVKFIVLNSQYYFDRSNCKSQAEEHDDWLTAVLNDKENKLAKYLIVFQHIPWFIDSVDEKNEYFNIDYDIRKDMLEKMSLAGVSKVFAGHCHKNAGGWFEAKNGHKMEIIVTSAVGYQLGKDEHGFRVVTVDADKISHEYVDVFVDR